MAWEKSLHLLKSSYVNLSALSLKYKEIGEHLTLTVIEGGFEISKTFQKDMPSQQRYLQEMDFMQKTLEELNYMIQLGEFMAHRRDRAIISQIPMDPISPAAEQAYQELIAAEEMPATIHEEVAEVELPSEEMEAEPLPVLPSSALPLITPQEALLTRLEAELTSADRKGFIGKLAPIALLLGNDLKRSLNQQQKGLGKTVEEIRDDLFLTTQALELFLTNLEAGRGDLLAVCYQFLLISSSLGVEQRLRFDAGVTPEQRFMGREHSLRFLSQLAQTKGRQFDPQTTRFFHKYNRVLIDANYLSSCDEFFGDEAHMPRHLKSLIELSKDFNFSEDFLKRVLKDAIQNYQKALGIMIGEENPNLQRYLICISKIESTLKPSAVKSKSEKDLPLAPIRHEVRKVMARSPLVARMENGNPLKQLKDVEYYLLWIAQAEEMQKLYAGNTSMAFLFEHLKLLIDKPFERLYKCGLMLHGVDKKSILSHDLAYLREMLSEYNEEKLPRVSALPSSSILLKPMIISIAAPHFPRTAPAAQFPAASLKVFSKRSYSRGGVCPETSS